MDIIFSSNVGSDNGSTDQVALLNNLYLYIGEFKPRLVDFITSKGIWELFAQAINGDQPAHGDITSYWNTMNTMIQTYSYLAHKCGDAGGVRYGFMTNWDYWVFFERRVVGKDDVLFATPWIPLKQARYAYACFLERARDGDGVLTPLGDLMGVPTLIENVGRKVREERDERKRQRESRRDSEGRLIRDGSGGWPASTEATFSCTAHPPSSEAASKAVVRTVITLTESCDFTVAIALPA